MQTKAEKREYTFFFVLHTNACHFCVLYFAYDFKIGLGMKEKGFSLALLLYAIEV